MERSERELIFKLKGEAGKAEESESELSLVVQVMRGLVGGWRQWTGDLK